MWSEKSLYDVKAQLQVVLFRAGAVLDGVSDVKAGLLSPDEALAALTVIEDALQGAIWAASWDRSCDPEDD